MRSTRCWSGVPAARPTRTAGNAIAAVTAADPWRNRLRDRTVSRTNSFGNVYRGGLRGGHRRHGRLTHAIWACVPCHGRAIGRLVSEHSSAEPAHGRFGRIDLPPDLPTPTTGPDLVSERPALLFSPGEPGWLMAGP